MMKSIGLAHMMNRKYLGRISSQQLSMEGGPKSNPTKWKRLSQSKSSRKIPLRVSAKIGKLLSSLSSRKKSKGSKGAVHGVVCRMGAYTQWHMKCAP